MMILIIYLFVVYVLFFVIIRGWLASSVWTTWRPHFILYSYCFLFLIAECNSTNGSRSFDPKSVFNHNRSSRRVTFRNEAINKFQLSVEALTLGGNPRPSRRRSRAHQHLSSFSISFALLKLTTIHLSTKFPDTLFNVSLTPHIPVAFRFSIHEMKGIVFLETSLRP